MPANKGTNMAITLEELAKTLLSDPKELPNCIDQLITMMQTNPFGVAEFYDKLADKYPDNKQIQDYVWLKVFAITMLKPWRLATHEPILQEIVAKHSDERAKLFVARLFVILMLKENSEKSQVVESFRRVFTSDETNSALDTKDILQIGGALFKDSPELSEVFWKHYGNELTRLSWNLNDFILQSDINDESYKHPFKSPDKELSKAEKLTLEMAKRELDHANGYIKFFLQKIVGEEPITSSDVNAFLSDKYITNRLNYLSSKAEGTQLVSDFRLLLENMRTGFNTEQSASAPSNTATNTTARLHTRLVRSASAPAFLATQNIGVKPQQQQMTTGPASGAAEKPRENESGRVEEHRFRTADRACDYNPERRYSFGTLFRYVKNPVDNPPAPDSAIALQNIL
jgi:hypothetical protein